MTQLKDTARNTDVSGSPPLTASVSAHAHAGTPSADTKSTRRAPTRGHTGIAPREASMLIRQLVLGLVNRFRLVRTIDIAAALFPERSLKVALSATHRALGPISIDSKERGKVQRTRTTKKAKGPVMLVRYQGENKQLFYGLNKAGAEWLRANPLTERDKTATASASTVCSKLNPDHELWGIFTTIACESRGLKSWTENEFKRLLGWNPEQPKSKVYPLIVPTQRRVFIKLPGNEGFEKVPEVVNKGLMPDAFVAAENGLTWIEVDKSPRGEDRREDLKALVLKVGDKLNHLDGKVPKNLLKRVVVLCKTQSILDANTKYLTGVIERGGVKVPRLKTTGGFDDGVKPVLNPVKGKPGCYDVGFFFRRKSGTLFYEVVGTLVLQRVPEWLPKFSYRGSTCTDGWFSDTTLPWPHPAKEGWPKLTSPLTPLARKDD